MFMNIKNILKELEKIKNDNDKKDYLNKLIIALKDKKLIEDIKSLAKKLDEDLEEKIEEIIVPISRRKEIERKDFEIDIEQNERQITKEKPIIRQEQIADENREVKYNTTSSNYNTISKLSSYQNSARLSDYQNVSLQNQVNTKLVEEILVKEMDFNIGQVINDVQREEIRDTIERFIPNASVEEKINAEKQVLYDMRFKNKDIKYIPKLR